VIFDWRAEWTRRLQELRSSKRFKPRSRTRQNAAHQCRWRFAAVLFDLGFPPNFGMLVFIVGRVAGLSAEVAEEYAREKPMRIRIPLTYDGEPPRSLD
jgi:citrate synthase